MADTSPIFAAPSVASIFLAWATSGSGEASMSRNPSSSTFQRKNTIYTITRLWYVGFCLIDSFSNGLVERFLDSERGSSLGGWHTCLVLEKWIKSDLEYQKFQLKKIKMIFDEQNRRTYIVLSRRGWKVGREEADACEWQAPRLASMPDCLGGPMKKYRARETSSVSLSLAPMRRTQTASREKNEGSLLSCLIIIILVIGGGSSSIVSFHNIIQLVEGGRKWTRCSVCLFFYSILFV